LFLKHNPLLVQAGFLPTGFLVPFLVASVLIGLRAQSPPDLYRFLGVLLFCVVGTSFARAIVTHGWTDSLFRHAFDISYFLFSMPFVLISVPREMNQGNGGARTTAASALKGAFACLRRRGSGSYLL
jgi:hypothetical protein